MDALDRIRTFSLKHDLLPRGEIVVVGVSGGPDSLCLLHALLALRSEFDCALHVAHLNHQLRGADADADAQFVDDLAARWRLPCTLGARDVAALAREHKLSIEEAARQARYRFLAEVARANHSQIIAVAHNADDQAESVLMHFLRGSGTDGLRGMRPISDFGLRILDSSLVLRHSSLRLIRPLLAVPRADVERYCREHDLQPRFDLSNLDTTFFRNRLRHELLPLLETYNPNIREVLRRTAEIVAAEVELLRQALEAAWREIVVAESEQQIEFKLPAWRNVPLALQRATLREAVRRLRPSLRNINFVHIEAAVSHLQSAQTGAQITLPQQLTVDVSYRTFTVGATGHDLERPDWPLLAPGQTLPVNRTGFTPLPDSDWQLAATHVEAWSDDVFTHPDPWTAHLDAAALGAELVLRTRTTGDMFHPQGMPAPLHLSDWMTNVKIPQRVRDRLPLLISGERIAWVAGFRIGQPFSVTSRTRRVLKLSFQR
ncbi:MAG TPA: tRNA lysidine(34) synthetase TilS [Anaerolineae bacterium]|nr:tRNA lysidine(34) synthetase TilS [Anaerolineae bacterium]